MKIIKLIPIIIKNLFLIIIFDWIGGFFRWLGWKKSLALFLILGVAISAFWYYRKKHTPTDPNQVMTLEEAAKIGEKTTLQLLVQIETPRGENSGRLERGDILLTTDPGHQFSEAETSGFLVLKMDLTPKQAELVVRSLQKVTDKKDETGNYVWEDVKRRKFAVDLKKIGIGDDVQSGRVVDKVYMWDVLYEKK